MAFDFTSADRINPGCQAKRFVVREARQPVTVAPKIEYSAEDLKVLCIRRDRAPAGLGDLANPQQHTPVCGTGRDESRAYGNESPPTAAP